MSTSDDWPQTDDAELGRLRAALQAAKDNLDTVRAAEEASPTLNPVDEAYLAYSNARVALGGYAMGPAAGW